MKKSGWTDTVRCTNTDEDCDAEIDVAYYPGHAGQTYGPPERCYPPEGDDIDCPEECPKCGHRFTDRDLDAFCEKLGEERRNQTDMSEDRYEHD